MSEWLLVHFIEAIKETMNYQQTNFDFPFSVTMLIIVPYQIQKNIFLSNKLIPFLQDQTPLVRTLTRKPAVKKNFGK